MTHLDVSFCGWQSCVTGSHSLLTHSVLASYLQTLRRPHFHTSLIQPSMEGSLLMQYHCPHPISFLKSQKILIFHLKKMLIKSCSHLDLVQREEPGMLSVSKARRCAVACTHPWHSRGLRVLFSAYVWPLHHDLRSRDYSTHPHLALSSFIRLSAKGMNFYQRTELLSRN